MADSAQYVTPVPYDWDPNNPYDGNPNNIYEDPYAGIGQTGMAGGYRADDPGTAAYAAKYNGKSPPQAAASIAAAQQAADPYGMNFYYEGLNNLGNTIGQQYAGYASQVQPWTTAAANNYYNGIGARQGIIDQQSGALQNYSDAQGALYGGYSNQIGALNQQGNDAVSRMGSVFDQSAGLDASNVSGLGSSLGNANYLDTQNIGALGSSLGRANALDAANMAELGGQLNQSNALGAQSLGQLQALNGSMRQLTAQGYGADVVSNPMDVARQEAAYGAFGDFASGAYDYTSQAAQAYADPESVAAQKDALGQLKEQSSPKLTDAERYLYMQARLMQEQSNRANRDANLRELQRSGMSGSTMALSNLNASSQEANNTRALSDLGANAEAIKRAQAALVNYGNLASTISGQSFQQAYGRGQAADAASQFNTNTKLQGSIAQGNMATQMRSADDALLQFNKAQSLQQQRFVDQYAADQQAQAWGRGVDVSNAGFKQADLTGRNAAVKSNAGFQQSTNMANNAGMLSDAGFKQTQNLSNNAQALSNAQFTQSGNLSRNATNLGNSQLTNIGQQGERAGDLSRLGSQMNSDWLSGYQNIGNQQMTSLRDNTSALLGAGDAQWKQTALQQSGDSQRNALVQKALEGQAEDVRAGQASSAARDAARNAIPDHGFGLGESVDENGHVTKRGLLGGYIIPGIF